MRLNATLLTASPPPQLKGKGATSGLTPAPSPRREGSDMLCYFEASALWGRMD